MCALKYFNIQEIECRDDIDIMSLYCYRGLCASRGVPLPSCDLCECLHWHGGASG